MKFHDVGPTTTSGGKIARAAWSDKWLELHEPEPDENGDPKPYLYLTKAEGEPVKWVATQEDLNADDWINL